MYSSAPRLRFGPEEGKVTFTPTPRPFAARPVYQFLDRTGSALCERESCEGARTRICRSLWHATRQGDDSDLRRIDPRSEEVLESVEMPRGVGAFPGWIPVVTIGFSSVEEKNGRIGAVQRPGRSPTRDSGWRPAAHDGIGPSAAA